MFEERMGYPLVGDKAPSFEADSTSGLVTFPDDYAGRWLLFMCHPGDFTPVCTSEFMTMATMQEEFREMNCDILAMSIDSIYSHIAWMKSIQEKLEYRGMKGVRIGFPIISDVDLRISKLFGIVREGTRRAHFNRSTFLMDPEGIIRSVILYPASAGRSIHELKRLLAAAQYSDLHKVGAPADWQPGEPALMPAPATWGAAQERMEEKGADFHCLDWYMCERKG